VSPSLTETVSPVDAAWLRMDRPTNPMTITALLVYEGELPFEVVRSGIETRLLAHPRFRQRVTPGPVPLARPRWTEASQFDLDAHVRNVSLAAPGDDDALQDLVSRSMSAPLDRARPLWEVQVVRGYRAGTALVVRLHHAIGDGVALVRVLLGVADAGAGAPRSHRPAEVGLARRRARGLGARARQGAAQVAALTRTLALRAGPPTALEGPLGTDKRAAWSRPLPLEPIRAAAHAVGGKVNDALLAAVAGAVRGYLAGRAERTGELAGDAQSRLVRTLMPVYIRGDEGLGNHFGLVFVDLPAGADPLARLRAAKATMDAVKEAPDALVAMKVLGAMGMASATVERIGVDIFTRKASLLVTNVPGPPDRVQLFGGALASVVVWAPVSGSVGVGVSLLSYGGDVRMSVASDAGRIPDPEALVAAFEAEIDALARVAVR
jgi:diacylglycerol O-acyltransferase / wax synthase